ncbi:hypothetical protein N9H51_01635, partial [Gammaproteobacteria bacterium]|nr:hypothetical protein [Gammaproteobacteria bacterium]
MKLLKKLVPALFFIVYYHFKSSYYYLKYKKKFLKNLYFKNLMNGQRCFIVGTGNSISDIDIDKLKNENIIFLNSF